MRGWPREQSVAAFGIAAGLAVVVAAGGGLVARDALSGGGPQPAGAAPATTFGFVSVDLDPPAAQKYAAARLGSRLGRLGSAGFDGRDAILRPLLRRLLPSLDYVVAVRPWRGERYALAVFRSPTGQPETVALVRCRDARTAARAVARGGAGAAVAVRHGYALLGSPTAVRDAMSEAGVLDAEPGFHRDLATLPRARVGVVWLDGAAANAGLHRRDPPGHVVAYAHVTSRSLQLDAVLTGTDAARTGDARALLRRLPEATVAGVAMTHGFPAAPLVGLLASTGLPASAVADGGVAALGGLPLGGPVDAGVLTRAPPPPTGRKLATQTADGWTASATSAAYAGVLLRGGDLGVLPGYRAAVGLSGPPLVLAAYADAGRLLPLLGELPSGTTAFDGLGLVAWRDGDRLRLRLRLVVA